MKEIKTVDAVGHVLCHDITQIIKDVTKDAVFRKGHVIREEDIPVLLSVGKEHVYVWEHNEKMLHENEAAEILRQLHSMRSTKRVTSVPKSELKYSSYAMLPVWFISVEKKGTPYTFLVNGQTGKVVGTVPWNRVLAGIMLATFFIAMAGLATWFFIQSGILPAALGLESKVGSKYASSRRDPVDTYEILGGMSIISAAGGLFWYGFGKFKKVVTNLNLSRSVVTFIFSKKRQGEAK